MAADLSGRVALVTGAGRGVGYGIVEELVEAGTAVALNDLHEDRAQVAARALDPGGGRVRPVPFDVTDLAAVRDGVAKANRDFGTIDILVNNAGLPEDIDMGRFMESDPSIWHHWVDINFYGSLYTVHSVLPGMVERHWGRIIQISSGVAARGIVGGNSIYGGSKAGIDGALRHIAIEEAKNGISINSIAPGLMTNAAGRQDPDDTRPGTLGGVPMGMLAEARWIGACVVWLCSEKAGFVTAQTIHINGGTIQGR